MFKKTTQSLTYHAGGQCEESRFSKFDDRGAAKLIPGRDAEKQKRTNVQQPGVSCQD